MRNLGRPLPEVEPDEFVLSHDVRLDRRSPISLSKLGDSNGNAEAKLLRLRLSSLISAANMTSFDYVQKHTLIPYVRAATAPECDLEHGDVAAPGVLQVLGLHVARPTLFVCRECALEDARWHGYSCYKRSQQLPGIYLCPKHRCPLVTIAVPNWRNLPHEVLEAGQAIDIDQAIVAVAGNAFVEQFAGLSISMLDHKRPVSWAKLKGWIRQRILEAGREDHPGEYLARLVEDRFPKPWLDALRVEAKLTDERMWFGAFARFSYRSGPSAPVVALTASVLAKDELAAQNLFDGNSHVYQDQDWLKPSSSKPPLRRGASARTRVIQGLTRRRRTNRKLVAKSIREWLAGSDLCHAGVRADQLKAALGLFVENKSVIAAANDAEISPDALEAVLRVVIRALMSPISEIELIRDVPEKPTLTASELRLTNLH